MMRGELIPQGTNLDADAAIRALDRISEDERLVAKLDRLGDTGVRSAFLDFYEEERRRSPGNEAG